MLEATTGPAGSLFRLARVLPVLRAAALPTLVDAAVGTGGGGAVALVEIPADLLRDRER